MKLSCLFVNHMFANIKKETIEDNFSDAFELYENKNDFYSNKDKLPGLGSFYGVFLHERYELTRLHFDNTSTKGQRVLKIINSHYLPTKTLHLIITTKGIFGIDEIINK